MGDDGAFEGKGHLNKPPRLLLGALQAIQSTYDLGGSRLHANIDSIYERHPTMSQTYGRPAAKPDKPRLDTNGRIDLVPRTHYGLIASGNKVIASAAERDRLRKEHEILCFETEAAGLMDIFPCLVIRGICDYANASKHDGWQKDAATTAAAFAKELILAVPSRMDTLAQPDARYEIPFSFEHVTPAKEFIGREAELRMLEDVLQPSTTPSEGRRILVIRAMGGMGKTQLCLKYVRVHKNAYSAVLWMNGASMDIVMQSFRHAVSRVPWIPTMYLDPQSIQDDEVVDAVLFWLSQQDNTRWLMIFDNVDLAIPDAGAYDINKLIPKADHGRVIITSRLLSLEVLGMSIVLSEISTNLLSEGLRKTARY